MLVVTAAAIFAVVGIASAHKYSSTPEIQGSVNLAAVIENLKEDRKVTFESASKRLADQV